MTKKQHIKTPSRAEKVGVGQDQRTENETTNAWLKPGLTLLALLIFTWVLYAPALKNGFTNWDDNVYVTENKHIAWNAENRAALSTEEVAGNFHPLTMWSLQWDHKRTNGKIDPYPYHRSNLLLHLFNTALLFLFVSRLSGNWLAAALSALLFAIHPMHVESVAWVSGRKDVLFSAFFLLGLLAYLKAREMKNTSAYLPWMAACFALFILSCLSKPAAIIFPAILWLIDWYKQAPEEKWTFRQMLPHAPFWLAAAGFSYLTLIYQKHIGAVDESYFSMLDKSLFAAYSAVVYLFKMVFPINLSAFHPVPDNKAEIGTNFYLAALTALGIVGYTVWAYWKGRKNTFFALAFYFIQIALVLGFIRVGSAVYAERYTYLAYSGLFMALGLGAHKGMQQGSAQKTGVIAAIALFSAFFAWKTREQIAVWKNSETLWNQIVTQYPTEKTLSYRGYHYYLNNQFDKALADFDKAYEKNPNNETTIHIRGLCLQKTGRFEDALQMFDAYDKQFPPKAEVKFPAAECLSALKRPVEAAQRYAQALELDPKNVSGWVNASTVYFSLNDHARTEECLSKALELAPENPTALNNRGACRLVMGKYAEAIQDLSKSLQMNPNQKQMLDYRSRCYERLGKKAEAEADRVAMGKATQ